MSRFCWLVTWLGCGTWLGAGTHAAYGGDSLVSWVNWGAVIAAKPLLQEGDDVPEPPMPVEAEAAGEAAAEVAPDEPADDEAAAEDAQAPRPARGAFINPSVIGKIRNLIVGQGVRPAIANRAAVPQPMLDGEQEAEATDSQGALDELDPVLSALADLTMVNDRLAVSRVASFQEFQQALYSNSGVFGGGGSSASGNGQTWTMNFQWTRIQGWARLPQQAGSSILFEVSENDGLRRQLHYEVDGDGKFELTLWTPTAPSFLSLSQTAEGPLFLTLLEEDEAVQISASTVSSLLKRMPAVARGRFLDTLRRLGVPFPPTPYHPAVMTAVRERLTQQVDQVLREQFLTRIEAFDADDFDQRQATSEQLQQEFQQWRQLIELAIDDEELSLEAHSRLREIYRKSADSKESSVQETIADLGLLDDIDFLILLASETAAEDEARASIFERLRFVSGETLADDLEAWTAWRSAVTEETIAEGADPSATDGGTSNRSAPFIVEGRLEKLQTALGRIALIRMESGQVTLDTQRWRAPFGERTIGDVNTQIAETLEQYGLPPSLWQGKQLESFGDTAFPVALLMRLEGDVQALPPVPPHLANRSHNSSSNSVTAHPRFSVNGVTGSLTTTRDLTPPHLRQNRQAFNPADPAQVVYHFAFGETAAPNRELRIGFDPTSQRFHVAIREPALEFLVTLAGSPSDGWVLQQLRDGTAIADRAASVDELASRHPEIFRDSLGVGLTFFGIESPWSNGSVATPGED